MSSLIVSKTTTYINCIYNHDFTGTKNIIEY